ncbi:MULTISPECIES: MerR family transcriptional regulator [Marinicauda]|jgi:MerR family mercuric resistance operon transcriptional regulator|uniref:MerR family transcriptional regulator n=1 Tax=Marinicauda TaxID=1649466 RepID=UPI0022E3C507|nr:helix-turn-helix domain-containing protein [Marinicauda sp. Alg238-R41]
MTITQSRGGLRRGALARKIGCNGETIRYYEKIGLLREPDRTQGGHRVYSVEDQRRLGFILRGRGLGFSIEQLRDLLCHVDAGDYTCGEVSALTRRHLHAVREKIAELHKMEVRLVQMTNACEGGRKPSCSIIDLLEEREQVAGSEK